MIVFTSIDPFWGPTGGRRLTRWWRAASPAAVLLVGAGAMITAAVMAWAVLDSTGLMTPMAFSTLGLLAFAGTAALHVAGVLAAIEEARRP